MKSGVKPNTLNHTRWTCQNHLIGENPIVMKNVVARVDYWLKMMPAYLLH